MKFFITGIRGFCGSNLARWLVAHGEKVAGLDLPTPEPDAWGALNPGLEADLFVGDIRRYDELLPAITLADPDIVVHLAAVSTVQAGQENARRAWITNVLGTVNVLEICREREVPVVVASSDKAYGGSRPPFRENGTPLNPLYPYDVSKACQDFITLSHARTFGVQALVTRSCNFYGPADLHWERLVPSVFRSLAKGDRVVLREDMGYVRRQWIHVFDVCRAYALLARTLVEEPQIASGLPFNIGSHDVLSRDAFVRLLLEAAGRTDVEPILELSEAREIGDEWVDWGRLFGLGWSPEVPLGSGLRMTWDWYKAYFEGGGE